MTDKTTDPIPRITRDMDDAGSGDVVSENVAALKALFPSIVTDGQVDFDVLRQLLGDAVEDGEERYGLNWKGKRRTRAFALTPTLATLRPAKDESKDWDRTRNIVIEGDNLEVLKCLRRSYAGQVKLIYIDPPYNTGNDFVYPDNYADSLGNYERLTGQRGDDGAAMTTNKEASGRFHTDWLNMMYPRLMLAKELLRDDGFVVVSIDDNEVASIRKLFDEILGEENFVANVVWRRTVSLAVSGEGVAVAHDHIIVYSRTRAATVNRLLVADEDSYSNSDNDHRGPYKKQKLERTLEGARPTMTFAIETPAGPITKTWSVNPDKFKELLADNRIVFSGSGLPYYKQFLSEYGGRLPDSWWGEQGGFNQNASRELTALMGEKGVFNNPKPVELLTYIETIFAGGGTDLIIDFFAGSGTTGHAIMAQNAADGGNRRYILVQLPEPLDPANGNQKTAADFCDTLGVPRTIAELTKERLRRAGAKVAAENPDKTIDTGFRVYKLATSNLKPWQPDPDNLAQSLLDAVENILPDRTEDDLLVELLLKTGIDLTLPMQTRTVCQRAPNDLKAHALGGGVLIVYLGDVSDADAEDLGQGIADWHAELDPIRATTFYFRDSGFATAAAKANVAAIIRQRVGNRVEKLASI